MGAGFFVTLEGIEGSGKSTQVAMLAAALRREGQRTLVTREPGGSRAGELIRAIFLDPAIALDRSAELLLVLADRAQHVRETIAPALAEGIVVISDRYRDSTIAYQGYGRGFDRKLLDELNRLASGGANPDLTFVLDCPVELGLARARRRQPNLAGVPDRFEGEQLEFHRRVREGFLAVAREDRARVVLIDSTRPPDEISVELLQIVTTRMAQP